MKSLDDITSQYGAAAFKGWLISNYYQHNLKLYIDSTVNKLNLKACLLNFENDSHLEHDYFNGVPTLDVRTSSFAEQSLRIILDNDFWSNLLYFLTENRTSFPVNYLYREEFCHEDGSKLNQRVYEHRAWKVIPKQYLSAHHIKLDNQIFNDFEAKIKKQEPKHRLKVLKAIRKNECRRIRKRNNCGKQGAFIFKIAMIDLCMELKKSPSNIEFSRYVKRVINLVVKINNSNKYTYFEHCQSGRGLQYTGKANPIHMPEKTIQNKITSMQKRSNLRELITEFYQHILD